MHAQENGKAPIITLIFIIAMLAVLGLVLAYHSPATAKHGFAYLNLVPSDINYVVNSSLYTPVIVNRITPMPASLQSAGYLEASVSLFNLTNASLKTEYPGVITSALYLMSNNSTAQQAFSSMLYSNNQNQSITGYTYKGRKIINYTFSGNAVKLYLVKSVALFNVSPSLVNLTLPYYMPDYQYTTLFKYMNVTGSVIINSYVPSSEYGNDSLSLAELIINKINSYYS